MKVICPKCEKSIAANYLNKSKGIAYCNYCEDYYVLEDHLRRSPYQIKREERLKKTDKPPRSTIDLKETEDGIIITIPRRLPLVVRLILTIFLGLIVYATYQSLTETLIINSEFYFKIGALLLLGLILIVVIVLKRPPSILTLTKDSIQLYRKRYVRSPYFRSRKMEGLDTIDAYHSSDYESGSSSGVEMNFVHESSLSFGHMLRSHEQYWLAGLLIHLRDTLTLDQKVRKDIDSYLVRARKNPSIVNIEKPAQSSIQSFNEKNHYTFVIPKDRKIGNAFGILGLYVLGVSIFGTVALGFWGFLPSFESHSVLKYVFLVFTLLATYGLLYYVYTFIYRAEHTLFISPTEIIIESKPFGIFYQKVRPTKSLVDITRSREWNCILLSFKGHRDLRLGFSLTKEEIAFLMGGLKKSVEKATSETRSDR